MAIYSRENNSFFERRKYTIPMMMPHAHYHDTHELYYLEKGCTKYFVGNEIFVLEPGDMVFIPKFVFHKTDNGERTDVERLRFSFDDGICATEFKQYIDELKEKRFIRIPAENQKELKTIFRNIENEERKKQEGYTCMQSLYFLQLLVLISRYCTANTSKLTESQTLIQSVAKYISDNCSSNLSLEHLSQQYAVSVSYLSRLFKKTMGIGLSEYINITRVTAAEKLLKSSDKTVTQIAQQCGFNDSNYFAAIFKKYKGITPKKYSMIK